MAENKPNIPLNSNVAVGAVGSNTDSYLNNSTTLSNDNGVSVNDYCPVHPANKNNNENTIGDHVAIPSVTNNNNNNNEGTVDNHVNISTATRIDNHDTRNDQATRDNQATLNDHVTRDENPSRNNNPTRNENLARDDNLTRDDQTTHNNEATNNNQATRNENLTPDENQTRDENGTVGDNVERTTTANVTQIKLYDNQSSHVNMFIQKPIKPISERTEIVAERNKTDDGEGNKADDGEGKKKDDSESKKEGEESKKTFIDPPYREEELKLNPNRRAEYKTEDKKVYYRCGDCGRRFGFRANDFHRCYNCGCVRMFKLHAKG
jgi:DNA-directed RNA polymerase subunit RPC12/RpoP